MKFKCGYCCPSNRRKGPFIFCKAHAKRHAVECIPDGLPVGELAKRVREISV